MHQRETREKVDTTEDGPQGVGGPKVIIKPCDDPFLPEVKYIWKYLNGHVSG